MTYPLEGSNGNADILFGQEDCDFNVEECEIFQGDIDRNEIAFKRVTLNQDENQENEERTKYKYSYNVGLNIGSYNLVEVNVWVSNLKTGELTFVATLEEIEVGMR